MTNRYVYRPPLFSQNDESIHAIPYEMDIARLLRVFAWQTTSERTLRRRRRRRGRKASVGINEPTAASRMNVPRCDIYAALFYCARTHDCRFAIESREKTFKHDARRRYGCTSGGWKKYSRIPYSAGIRLCRKILFSYVGTLSTPSTLRRHFSFQHGIISRGAKEKRACFARCIIGEGKFASPQ